MWKLIVDYIEQSCTSVVSVTSSHVNEISQNDFPVYRIFWLEALGGFFSTWKLATSVLASIIMKLCLALFDIYDLYS